MEKLRQNCDESAEFIQRFKNGDPSAFNEFCITHRYIVAAAVKGRCNPSEIEDVIQDTLMKAFRSRANYDPSKSKLSTWLSRIAISIAIDLYRSKKTKIKTAPIEGVDKTSDQNQNKIDLYKAVMARLSVDDANLARLKFIEDMKCEDIAKALDMQIGTVKSSIFRLKKKIVDWSENAR